MPTLHRKNQVNQDREHANPYEPSKHDFNQSSGLAATTVSLKGQVAQMQLIWIVLTIGVCTILAIILMFKSFERGGLKLKTNIGTEAIISAIFAASCIPASFIVPAFIRRQAVAGQRQNVSAAQPGQSQEFNFETDILNETQARLVSAYANSAIVGHALLEGSAMISAVLFFLSSSTICLSISGLLVFQLAMRLPTITKVQNFLIDSSSGEGS